MSSNLNKTQQIQIRVTATEKAFISARAENEGKSISEFILSKVLSSSCFKLQSLIKELDETDSYSYIFSEIGKIIMVLTKEELEEIFHSEFILPKKDFSRNYIAAMLEKKASEFTIAVPRSISEIPPLQAPFFASKLISLKIHLLLNSPAAFKRRNIFIDSTYDMQV